MIRFKELTLKNFMSYGNFPTTVHLDKKDTILIIGKNLDDTSEGVGANGTGKTSIIDALVFALYGKPLSKIPLGNLVNFINNKDMEVTVAFEINGTHYFIRRGRKSKSGASVQLFVKKGSNKFTSKDEKTRDSIQNTNEAIENILGVPHEIFCRIIVFSALHQPFLDLPATHTSQPSQARIIEELFGLLRLTLKAKALKQEIKDTKQEMAVEQAKTEQQKLELQRYGQQLESTKKRIVDWEKENAEKIIYWQKTLEELDKIDDIGQEELFDSLDSLNKEIEEYRKYEQRVSSVEARIEAYENNRKKEIIRLTEKLKKIADIDVDAQQKAYQEYGEVDAEINKKVPEFSKVVDELKRANKEIDSKEKILEHLQSNKCPYCLQKYADAKSKIKEVTSTLTTLLEKTDELDERAAKLKSQIEALKEKRKEIQSRITVTNLSELLEIQSQSGKFESSLEDLKNSKNPYTSQLQELEAEKPELKLSDLEKAKRAIQKKITIESRAKLGEIANRKEVAMTNVTELKKTQNPFASTLEDLEDTKPDPINNKKLNHLAKILDHQDFLLKLLTKKDSFVRKILINKNTPYLNHRLKEYLVSIGLPHVVEFTPELTAKISQFGRELDFGNLSSGQKARVNIALSLAFRDILLRLHSKVNVCILDEVLDVGLDTKGVQAAANMLKQKAISEGAGMFIISHRDEIEHIFQRKLVVEMKDGFSYIEEE